MNPILNATDKSYSYLMIIDPDRERGLFKSYFIPDNEITQIERTVLQEMQIFGALDYPGRARPLKEKSYIRNAIVLYLFKKNHSNKDEDEIDFVEGRKKGYECLYNKKFQDLGKWVKYRRERNTECKMEVSHIYELVDNTYDD